MLKSQNKAKLTAILTYHVIPEKIMSGNIKGKKINVKTVEGSELVVDAVDGVRVDNAKGRVRRRGRIKRRYPRH